MNHKNICKAIEFFQNDTMETCHSVMEHVEGKEILDSIIDQPDGIYSEKVAKDLFK